MSKYTAIILIMELVGAAIVSFGFGLVFVPAGVIAAGLFVLAFTIALDRSDAQ